VQVQRCRGAEVVQRLGLLLFLLLLLLAMANIASPPPLRI
jgi:hypothetical protein